MLLGLSLVAAYGLTVASSESAPAQTTLFFGHLHPIVVHLPIGFLVGLILLELYCLRRPSAGLAPARWILLGGACITSVLAAVLGLCQGRGGDYDPELIFWHQWYGIATAGLTIAATGIQLRLARTGGRALRRAYGGVLTACLIVITLAGHDGASLTHGPDFLTEHLPSWLKGEGTRPGEAEQLGFARSVLPIFRAKCISCHGPGEQEGELRLDDVAQILEGGESGRPAVLPGDLSASHMVERITLPREHEKAMPPRQSPRLSPEELRTILRWINQGAPGLESEEGRAGE